MRTRGILDPGTFGEAVTLERLAPPAELGHVVERFWTVRWDLRGQPPRESATLPYPCVNLVIGSHRPGVHGTTTNRFVAHLADAGWVLGTKFRPAGFRPLSDRPMTALVDDDVPIATMFGPAGAALERDVHALADMPPRIARVTEFLHDRLPPIDPEAEAVNRIVELAESERELTRVAELAARARLPVRTLERLFRRHVGVTPKWVIRRFRVQEAAARVAAGAVIEWSALAHDLGFFDQAHFIREFKAQVGRTPSQYLSHVARR
jgi:AraC-like DNA-binding protein